MQELLALYRFALRTGDRRLAEALARAMRSDPVLRRQADVHLRLLLRLNHLDLRLRLVHLNLRLSHRDINVRPRHADDDLRLRDVDMYLQLLPRGQARWSEAAERAAAAALRGIDSTPR